MNRPAGIDYPESDTTEESCTMAKRWVIGGLAVGVGALVLAPEARTWLRRPDLIAAHDLSAETSELLNKFLSERRT